MAERIRLEDRECPLSATLGLVGEWWTLLILHDAFDGYTRFDQFQDNLGISSSLLTSRLKRLVDVGLLQRRKYQTKPVRNEYVLTELGRSMRPGIVTLAAWGNARLTEPAQRGADRQRAESSGPILVDRATGRRRRTGLHHHRGPAARYGTAMRGAPLGITTDSSDTERRRSRDSAIGSADARGRSVSVRQDLVEALTPGKARAVADISMNGASSFFSGGVPERRGFSVRRACSLSTDRRVT
jgi:DNA-binding HxlR family transcriptional regulator